MEAILIPRQLALFRCCPCVLCGCTFLRTQEGKQNYVADGVGVGKQHAEAIDANTNASGRRHSVGERTKLEIIHLVGYFVPPLE